MLLLLLLLLLLLFFFFSFNKTYVPGFQKLQKERQAGATTRIGWSSTKKLSRNKIELKRCTYHHRYTLEQKKNSHDLRQIALRYICRGRQAVRKPSRTCVSAATGYRAGLTIRGRGAYKRKAGASPLSSPLLFSLPFLAFRLVPNSVTLDDLEQRNSPIIAA